MQRKKDTNRESDQLRTERNALKARLEEIHRENVELLLDAKRLSTLLQAAQSARASLELEIGPLRKHNQTLNVKLTRLAGAIAGELPVLSLTYADAPVRFIWFKGEPLVLAKDVFARLPTSTWRRRRGGFGELSTRQKANQLGFSGRGEFLSLWRADIARELVTADRLVSDALGLPRQGQQIAFLSPAALPKLKARKRAFFQWLSAEAFPAVVERFGKGGAS